MSRRVYCDWDPMTNVGVVAHNGGRVCLLGAGWWWRVPQTMGQFSEVYLMVGGSVSLRR